MKEFIAAAVINCINATNMVICDDGTTIYNHGSQSDVYNQHGQIAEIYRPYKQIDITQIKREPITPELSDTSFGLKPLE